MSAPERWVLISEGLDGESRATVAAVRALAADGYRTTVTVSGKLSLAASSRFCSRVVRVPPAYAPGYAPAIRAELETRPYVTVLPTSDAALIALDAPVQHFLDKAVCADRARGHGIEVAPTRAFESGTALLEAAHELSYPVVVKPVTKRYAAGRVDDATQLTLAVQDDGPALVQPFLEAEGHAVAGLMWGGRLVQSVHMRYVRMWPLPCGTVASAVTTDPDVELERKLTALLEGYDGVFHAEFLGPYLQDLNPRVHGTLPLAAASGVNLVSSYCRLTEGGEVEARRGAAGVFFRWIEGDMRSILKARRTGRMGLPAAVRAMMPRRNVIHSYEALDDLGPMLTRARLIGRRAVTLVKDKTPRSVVPERL